MVRATRRRQRRGRPDPVLQVEDDALRALAANTGDLRESRQILARDRAAHTVRAVDAEHGLGKSGAYAGRTLQRLEDVALVSVGETVEGQFGLADDQGGDQARVLPDPQPGQGRRGALHQQPDPADLDDGGVG